MTNTANSLLSQIQKTEEDATKMIAQAQKTRDEKIAKAQSVLQKKYLGTEEELKEKASLEATQQKKEIADKGKQILHDAQKEVVQLKTKLEAKVEQAFKQGLKILNNYLGI